jgi:hypothetical protein
VEITAGSSIDLNAPVINLNAALSKAAGIVKGVTLVADVGVISPVYTPGAGNAV